MRRQSWGRSAFVMIGTLLLVSSAGAAVAQTEEEGSASAEAHAAEVRSGDNSMGISHTKADSGSGDTSANSLEFSGEPAHESTGGSAGSGQEAEGAAFDTDAANSEGQYGRIALLPWTADGVNTEAFAAFLLIRVDDPDGNEAVYLSLLESSSKASGSSGSATSDAAILRLGGDQLVVNVLHTEAATDGSGMVYVLGINDTTFFTSDDANGQCVLEVPDVATLNCLTVESATPQVLAEALGADVADGSLAALLMRAEVMGAQQAGPDTTPAPEPFDDVLSRSSALPRTGDEAATRALAGLALLAAAGMAFAASRRSDLDVGLTEIRELDT